jgi:hypothetical protein
VPNVNVTFTVIQGTSTPSPGATLTNASGIAAVSSWLISAFSASLGDNVYNQLQATVAAGGVSGNPVTFTGVVTVSLASDLMTLFGGTCAGCHNGGATPLDFTGGAAAVYPRVTVASQRYVVPGDSVTIAGPKNLLFHWPSPANGVHSGGNLITNVLTIIKAWIKQGAPNN